ncbi:MAG: hypothetical protein WDO71_01610 [Bacteroidota bacterium]
MALHEPNDIMRFKLLDEPKVVIINKDEFNLPTEPEKKCSWSCFIVYYGKAG